MLRRHPCIPLRRLLRHGRRDFVERGGHALRLLVDHAGPSPSDRVPAPGCGPGAPARVLVPFPAGGASEDPDVVRRA